MGDDLVAAGRHERLPACAGRRVEPGDGVVELADQPADPPELAAGVQQVKVARPGDRAGHEGEDLAAVGVDAERTRRAAEAHVMKVGEQPVDRRGPRARRAAHGTARPDDALAHVSAAERYLGACHRLAAP
jgi:hypothetical protein